MVHRLTAALLIGFLSVYFSWLRPGIAAQYRQ